MCSVGLVQQDRSIYSRHWPLTCGGTCPKGLWANRKQDKTCYDWFYIYFTLHNYICVYICIYISIHTYTYCIYSLNCLWQQINSDIHVKFTLIKLYKNCLLWENTATPQIFIPEDRQRDGSMATEKRLSSPVRCCEPIFAFYAFLQCRESKSFH